MTSYDYDAPLDEAGNPTEKFFAFREVIARYAPVPDELPAAAEAAPAFEVPLTPAGARTDLAGPASTTAQPETFDALGHLSALVRYDTELRDARGGLLVVDEVRDLAWVSVDDRVVGTLSRTRHDRAIRIPDGRTLSILVEDQGRVNYDRRLGEEKGLIGEITLDGAPVTGWRSTPLDVAAIAAEVDAEIDTELDAPTGTDAADVLKTGPAAWTSSFTLDAPTDLVLDTMAWSKGLRVRERLLPRPLLAQRSAAHALRARTCHERGGEPPGRAGTRECRGAARRLRRCPFARRHRGIAPRRCPPG